MFGIRYLDGGLRRGLPAYSLHHLSARLRVKRVKENKSPIVGPSMREGADRVENEKGGGFRIKSQHGKRRVGYLMGV